MRVELDRTLEKVEPTGSFMFDLKLECSLFIDLVRTFSLEFDLEPTDSLLLSFKFSLAFSRASRLARIASSEITLERLFNYYSNLTPNGIRKKH